MQHHQTHLNHYQTIQRNRKADEQDKIARAKRQQERQELQQNLALRRARAQQQQQAQQQLQQQPPLPVEEEEETPPNDLPDVIGPPLRPQKEPGKHRTLMEFEPEQSKWKRRKSCNRIKFIHAFDHTNNQYHLSPQEITSISERRRAKSMSHIDLVTVSDQEARFISSAVLHVLDQKEADQFVKDKLMENHIISRITREEISAVIALHEMPSNSDTSRSTEAESSFHSIPTSNEEQSPTKVTPVKTPTKLKPPRLPELRQKSKVLKETIANWDKGTTLLAQQLLDLGAKISVPGASESVPSTSTCEREPAAHNPCLVCDNSRYYVFSPEARKNLKCSCSRNLVTDIQTPQQQPQQPPQPRPQKPASPTTRKTRYGGVKQGVWDKASHVFKPNKKS